MTQEDLQKWIEDISLCTFNRPFLHKATFNNRLRSTGGRYHLDTHNLDFNPKILSAFGKETFIGIIKHELCHYHLHLAGKGYRHADADFKYLLHEVGGLRYTPSLEAKQGTVWRWEYQCLGCENKIYRKRRFNPKKYICTQCKNYFKLKNPEKVELPTTQ